MIENMLEERKLLKKLWLIKMTQLNELSERIKALDKEMEFQRK